MQKVRTTVDWTVKQFINTDSEYYVSHFAAETAIKLLEVSETSVSSIGLRLSFSWHKGHFISSMGQTLNTF
jgi:hypothetical protein